MRFVIVVQKMATAWESSDEEDAEQTVLGDELSALRSTEKKLFERARSVNEELERIAKRERECVDELHRLRVEKHDRKQRRTAVKRVIELESELKDVKSENANLRTQSKDSSAVVELYIQLRQTTEQRNKAEEKLNATRQRLSDVQERLTVAEQVTAATQQRALQESDNSEQLQVELTPRQPTASIGLTIKSSSHYACMNVYLFGN